MAERGRRAWWRVFLRWQLWLTAVAATLLLVPVPVSQAEQWFGRAWYPIVQQILTRLSNRVPFALIDVALVGLCVWGVVGIVRLARSARGARLGALARALRSLVVLGATGYLVFLAAWGMNYRRPPLSERLDFDPARVTPESLKHLIGDLVSDLNRLRRTSRFQEAEKGPWYADLEEGFLVAQQSLGLPGDARPARPKWSILDGYFTRSGVSGMTDPFFLETLVASNCLPFERAAIVAHEWGHLAGLARESDASFFGWLVCLKSIPAFEYSGDFELFVRALPALTPSERRSTLEKLSPAVREDLRAVNDRNARDRVEFVSVAAWKTYDRFLRANRVASGMLNYDEVVALVLGTRFRPDGLPVLRPEAK